ncbi:MAG: methyltransferase domain-containing protein [Proteobacteria bacterium]|nr:methyltransferase domain-containing protein [Pseudomonadota bacterium]MDA1238232.1 methyltransferase domain-containing protein [Pseudomonadota bacterium]
MSSSEALYDRQALTRNRLRSSSITASNFLLEEVAQELKERLLDSNRSFFKSAIVTGNPNFWKQWMPDAEILKDDDILSFEGERYDLIIHAMCLHWSNDPVGQLVQCKKALKPDGLFLGSLLGGQTLSELRQALLVAESTVSNGVSPRLSPTVDIREVGNLLQRVGLTLPVADASKLNVSYGSVYHLMRDLRAMGETNVLKRRMKTFTSRRLFLEVNRIYSKNHKLEDDKIRATFELIFLAGWAPDISQPQPLRPGSAQTHFSEVLNNINENLGPFSHLDKEKQQDE